MRRLHRLSLRPLFAFVDRFANRGDDQLRLLLRHGVPAAAGDHETAARNRVEPSFVIDRLGLDVCAVALAQRANRVGRECTTPATSAGNTIPEIAIQTRSEQRQAWQRVFV